MELKISNISNASLALLKKLQSVEADLEIAKRIVANNTECVNYFLSDFSKPFLDYIGENIMKREGVYISGTLHFYPLVSTEYYEFISAKIVNTIPEWHKVRLYKGLKNKGNKDARLYTYISTITARHFYDLRKKELKEQEITASDVLENDHMAILMEYDGFDEIEIKQETDKYTELDIAMSMLPVRDQLILKYLIIEDRDPIEIFDEMILYTQTKKDPKSFSNKQKQDAMSLMKQRAKEHLLKFIVELKKRNNYETFNTRR